MGVGAALTGCASGSIGNITVNSVPLPSPYGVFYIHAFERPSGHVYVAMVMGDVNGADDVLVRIHSECLTGDALGSLRCDCGVQLRTALRMISARRCGVLVYATDHEQARAWARAQRCERVQAQAVGAAGGENHAEPVRALNKLGRNDPCWCGSGKKYKYCHGLGA